MFKIEKMLLEEKTVFPMKKLSGEVCGEIERMTKASPKYICRGELGFVGNTTTKNETIIFCEGVIATIQAEQQGFDNVLGFMSVAAFTDETITYLKDKNKKVILFFDQDEYGKKSVQTIAEKMRKAEINVKVFETDVAIDMQQFLSQGHSAQEILGI